jgi:hypothetical protein
MAFVFESQATFGIVDKSLKNIYKRRLILDNFGIVQRKLPAFPPTSKLYLVRYILLSAASCPHARIKLRY